MADLQPRSPGRGLPKRPRPGGRGAGGAQRVCRSAPSGKGVFKCQTWFRGQGCFVSELRPAPCAPPRRDGAGGMGGCPLGHHGSPGSWVGAGGGQQGHGSGAEGEGGAVAPVPAMGRVGGDPDPGAGRSPGWLGARRWQGQGGAMPVSPPSPASSFSVIAAET